MKHLLRFAPPHLLLAAGLLLPVAAQAQSVGIGTTTPAAGSALDIRATDRGLLIPRLTAAQRTAIVSPPQGLMVYQTDGTAGGGVQTGFWYYAGTGGWVLIDPAPGGGGSFTLPYSGVANTGSPAFAVANNGAGRALTGTVGGSGQAAVSGENTNPTSGSGTGVLGQTVSGFGVRGTASGTNGYGVVGEAIDSRGVSGTSNLGAGLYGSSNSGVSVQAQKTSGSRGRVAEFTNFEAGNDSTTVFVSTPGDRPAVRAVNTSASSQAAIRGVKQGSSLNGSGVEGIITSGAIGSVGVLGRDQSGSNTTGGVLGLTAAGYGVRGVASAAGFGVVGSSQSGSGVLGAANSNATGVAGVVGTNSAPQGVAVRGVADDINGTGVLGLATGINAFGIRGVATDAGSIGVDASTSGTGPALRATASGTGRAAFLNQTSVTNASTALEASNAGTGRTAYFNQSNASSTANALEVQNASLGRTAFFSQSNVSNTNSALEITNAGQRAALTITHPAITTFPSSIRGIVIDDAAATAQATITSGLFQLNPLDGSARGVSFSADNGGRIAIRNDDALTLVCNASGIASPQNYAALNAQATGGALAARFLGNVAISGTLSKGGGSFKIDHPLDPANQYLYHSFVESPDMLNVYNGNVVLDAQGEATVRLPDYFEALNRDFRYQLTPIGAAFTPYVKAKVAGNQFRIAGQPGAEVSWQVTGIRQDKWANANRIPNAVAKEPENQGKYLHPEVFGQPAARGIGYRPEAVLAPAASRSRVAAPTPATPTPARAAR